MLDAIIAVALGFDLAVILLWLFAYVIGKIYDLFHEEPPPYCDIDPLCHAAFTWGKDGSGVIGGYRVIKATSGQS